ncbi:HD domain-containing protein [Geoglobus acetivorans]|uniref:5'-deoxynucleotidase n=1 Tax=Geoglobus acetivorans TaxID=565033 RepID=A0ABZ3H3H8_GEOAI|nr:HD domain-containing protein [Geoglobus acetivorans]
MPLERLIFELASLKSVPRSGWLKVGIENPESVAEHSFLSAVIAFFLGLMEYGNLDDASKCGIAALFHDSTEARTLDLHKLAKMYVDVDTEKAFDDQMDFEEARVLRDMLERYGDIVHDADKLELYVQSRIYGLRNSDAELFGRNIELKTSSGQSLYRMLENADPRWWMEFEVRG